MFARTTQTAVPLIVLLSVVLLAGCVTGDTKQAYRSRTSCPPSFLPYCKTLDYGSQGATTKCRCVRQDAFNPM